MRLSLKNLPLFASLLLCLSSCDYFCDCEEEAKPCMFTYDQLVYTPNDGSSGEQLAAPRFDGTQSEGTFSSHPEGLVIDSLSGEINVNASIAGEYTVAYMLDDGKTSCETKVAIGKGETEPSECELRYSDENQVFFRSNSESLLIRPIGEFKDTANFRGRFSVWPQGLDIDPTTGVISVNTSEPGLTYQVTFTSEDKSTTCATEVIIGGVDYQDVILDFDGAVSDSAIAANPFFRQYLVVGTTAGPTINFDADVGFSTEGREDGLIFSDSQGAIDVRGTLQVINDSEFNGEIPNGFFREFVVAYQYVPPGQQTFVTSEVEFVIYYFQDAEDIPQSLLELLGRKSRVPGSENGRLMHRHGIMCGAGKL